MWGVEGEKPRLDFLDRETANRAGETGGEHRSLRLRVGSFGVDDAIGHGERGFEAIGQAAFHAGAHHDTVDHRLDIMLRLAVERWDVGNLV